MAWREAERRPMEAKFVQVREHQIDVLEQLEEEGELEIERDDDGELLGVSVLYGDTYAACEVGTYLVREDGDLMPLNPDVFKQHFRVLA